MGFPPNPEKQEFIRLRLEQNARPGGKSKANAKKYYGGLYHRLSPEVRSAEVEAWSAGQAKESERAESGTSVVEQSAQGAQKSRVEKVERDAGKRMRVERVCVRRQMMRTGRSRKARRLGSGRPAVGRCDPILGSHL